MRAHLIFKNARYGNGVSRNILYNDAAYDSRGLYFCNISKSSRGRVLTPEDTVILFSIVAGLLIAGGMWYGDRQSSKRNK
jgi:hypothetical protein